MSTSKRIDNFKDFTSGLQIIEFVESLKSVDIFISKEDKFATNAKISKKDQCLILEINNRDLFSLKNEENINNVSAIINDKDLFIDSLSTDSPHTNIDNYGTETGNMICSLNVLRNGLFSDDFSSTFRCFIPTDKSRLNSFRFQFETVTYQDKQKEYFFNCIRFNVNNILFDLIQLKIDNKGYFVIEAFQDIKFKEFCDYCFSIRQALGFITGYMPGGEEFYFSKNLDFYYINSLRPSITSMYYPIDANPYSLLYKKNDIAERFKNKLNILSTSVFSNLTTKIHNNLELSSLIILILEASSISSLLLIPSIFAVTVESLSKLITEKEIGSDLPIEDKTLAKSIINKLNQIVDSYSEQLSDKGKLKIRRRINEINRPIVKEKLTNNEKLTRPFEQLNLDLTIEDITIIEHRNDLLHGNILLINNIPKNIDETNNYMGYVSSKLYTLISSLILKHVGYNGYIINHAKFYEEFCNLQTNEDYYKLL